MTTTNTTRTEGSPREIGGYRILEEIGRGGFAVVYKAEHLHLKKIVALKLLSPALFYEADAIRRFIQEARAMAALRHPHIARVLDLDEDEGRLYMVMNYYAGGDLASWLAAHPHPHMPTLIRWLAEVADALDFAHAQGVVHGDAKPANILLDEDERHAVLVDFGMLRAIERSTASSEVTRGTPYYTSPEQARGEAPTPRSDQYALAVVAYEALSGKVPFDGDTPVSIYLKHLREAPPAPSSQNPQITPEMEAVLLKALSKEPEARYPSCSAFVAALREAVVATERERFVALLRQAEAALGEQRLEEARQALEEARQIAPEDPQFREALQRLSAAEQAQRAYVEAQTYRDEARAAMRQYREHTAGRADAPDPEALAARLAPLPPPAWKAYARRWPWVWQSALAALALGVLLALGWMGYASSGAGRMYRATLVAIVRTSTPTPTPTYTPIPTPTPTLTPTPTFTPTPTPPPVALAPDAVGRVQVLGFAPAGEHGAVRALALLPDGLPDGQLAVGHADGAVTLLVWPLDGAPTPAATLLPPPEGGRRPLALAWLPQPGLLLAARGEDSLAAWRAADGAVLTYGGAVGTVSSVAFSPEGALLASVSRNSTVWLWKVLDGTVVGPLEGHIGTMSSVAFSPDGTLLASGLCRQRDSMARCIQGVMHLWRVSDGTLVQTLEYQGDVNSVDFSPDGALLASASGCCDEDSVVQLRGVSDRILVRTLEGHTGTVGSVAFSPDGTLLALGSCGERDSWGACIQGEVRLRRVSDGALVRTLEGHTGWVRSVAFSPDGRLLASGSRDHTVRLWRVSDGALVRTLEGHTDWVDSVVFSPDGRLLASGARDGTVRLWRVSDGALVRTLEGHTDWVSSVAFSPDGTLLASGADDNTVRLWRVSDGQPLGFWTGFGHGAQAVAAASNWFAVGDGEGDVTLWDGTTGLAQHRWHPVGAAVRALALAPDASWVLSAHDDRTLALWSPDVGTVWHYRTDYAVRALASLPDGRTVLMLGSDNRVHRVEVDSTRHAPQWDWRSDPLTDAKAVAVSPDGRLAVVGTAAGVVFLDAEDGSVLATLPVGGAVRALAFSEDGLRLYAGLGDGRVAVLGVPFWWEITAPAATPTPGR